MPRLRKSLLLHLRIRPSGHRRSLQLLFRELLWPAPMALVAALRAPAGAFFSSIFAALLLTLLWIARLVILTGAAVLGCLDISDET